MFSTTLRGVSRRRSSAAAVAAFVSVIVLAAGGLAAQPPRVRARDLGIVIGTIPPGPNNAITDVAGVLVGHATIVRGEGALKVGAAGSHRGDGRPAAPGHLVHLGLRRHPYPERRRRDDRHALDPRSGDAGAPDPHHQHRQHRAVHDAAIAYITERQPKRDWGFLPVVAETWDGTLNDIRGRHVQQAHVFAALDNARGGAVAEGNVGGGTGMICYRFKCGIGTSSRKLAAADGGYTVGVLVQANFGLRDQLRIDGVPVGREIPEAMPDIKSNAGIDVNHEGSVIVVVATDAPVSSRQLERMARRASLGLAHTGTASGNTSGDIILASRPATAIPMNAPTPVLDAKLLSTDGMDPVFRATVEATEEAVVNALMKGETMTGINGNTVYALPYDRLRQVMAKYGRVLAR